MLGIGSACGRQAACLVRHGVCPRSKHSRRFRVVLNVWTRRSFMRGSCPERRCFLGAEGVAPGRGQIVLSRHLPTAVARWFSNNIIRGSWTIPDWIGIDWPLCSSAQSSGTAKAINRRLIATVIETTILPSRCYVVVRIWDHFSQSQWNDRIRPLQRSSQHIPAVVWNLLEKVSAAPQYPELNCYCCWRLIPAEPLMLMASSPLQNGVPTARTQEASITQRSRSYSQRPAFVLILIPENALPSVSRPRRLGCHRCADGIIL